MAIPINPYIIGNPVGETAVFVGREDVLRKVLSVLHNPTQNAITLYGQRRIGKTSLLQYLRARLPAEGCFLPVLFDLQDKAALPLGRVLFDLARSVADCLRQPPPDFTPQQAPEAFRQAWLPGVLASLPADHNLVLLFDEFDVLADPKGGQAADEFFPYLRSLLALDPAHLRFVFVLGRNVTDLSSIALSVFKGVPAERVSLLAQKDAARLARLSQENGSLAWPDEAVQQVWALAHGHPFLTQALCAQVWEAAYQDDPAAPPLVTPQMVEQAAAPALSAYGNALEWLWDGLGPAERVVMAALAQAGPRPVSDSDLEQILREGGVRIVIRELQHAPQLLQDWDILEPVEGGYIFRVELLRRWVAQAHKLNRVQQELDRIQPVAENLYQAARGMFENGSPEAQTLLQQALQLNPSHVRANELLAEIWIAHNRWDEARRLLEKLWEIAPAHARPRLVQVYLAQAENAADDDARLESYGRALALDARQPAALAGISAVWRQRAIAAQQSGDLPGAEACYRRAGDETQAEAVRRQQEENMLLAARFVHGRQALEQGQWETAAAAFKEIVCLRCDYAYDGAHAADLLAEAVRQGRQNPPRWKVLLHRKDILYFLGGFLALALLVFVFGLGSGVVSLGREGYGPMAYLATPTHTQTSTPTSTPTSTATPTQTSTSTNTATPTQTPTVTPTQTPTSTNTVTPTLTRTSTATTTFTPTATPNAAYTATAASLSTAAAPLRATAGLTGTLQLHLDAFGAPMALIPAGPFQMGSDRGDTDELPIHTVTLDAFYIDVYEVTNARYAACVAVEACQPPAASDSYTRDSYYDNPDYADYPVIFVSWEAAQTYCQWRGGQLPTEAQWEKAARGGLEGKLYPWGDTFNGAWVNFCDTNCSLDWADNDYNDGSADTAPVGSFAPNGYGLYDMAGNVWEWVSDWYGSYPDSSAENPTGPASGEYRVLRGGSWDYDAVSVRVAYRGYNRPTYRFNDLGFRCVVLAPGR